MHSTRGCVTSRRVSIIQARAFSAMIGSDALFPYDFINDGFVFADFRSSMVFGLTQVINFMHIESSVK